MTSKKINISKDFSKAPAGRYREDSDASGEAFREDFLVRALKDFDEVIVCLDNLGGVGSSFWDEAFGGLIRVENYSNEDLEKKLKIICNDDSYLVDHVISFIEDALVENNI